MIQLEVSPYSILTMGWIQEIFFSPGRNSTHSFFPLHYIPPFLLLLSELKYTPPPLVPTLIICHSPPHEVYSKNLNERRHWSVDFLNNRVPYRECAVTINDTVDSLYNRFMYPEGIKSMAEAVQMISEVENIKK